MKYSVDEKGRVVITGPNGEEIETPDAFRFIKYKLKTDKDFRKQFYKDGEDEAPVFVVKRNGKDYPILYEHLPPPPVVVEEKAEEKKQDETVKETQTETEKQQAQTKQPQTIPPIKEKDFLTEAAEFLKKYAGEIGEVAISLLPIVGDVYDVLVALLGKSPLTGEKLDWTDRLLSLAGVLPIPFVSGKLLRYGKKAVEWILDADYIQKLVKEYIPKALAWMKEQWESAKAALASMGFGAVRKNTPVKLNRAIINGLEIAKRKLNYIEAKSFGKTVYKGPIDLRPALDRIKRGDIGQHIYKNDGTVFKNLPDATTGKVALPNKPPGYYKEYFVPLNGVSGTPPTRIVIGESGEVWFTADHYESFIKLN